jgi:hypothetical protein
MLTQSANPFVFQHAKKWTTMGSAQHLAGWKILYFFLINFFTPSLQMQPLNHMVFESFRQTYSKELS